jgi:ParB-like chromosome segregation protein Spo0J
MNNRSTIAAASKDIVFVPLCKLKKSPKNVRQIPHSKAIIKALAASIAAVGMLQYPLVEPEVGPKGRPTGNYLVNAGEGRRLAQLLRVKRKEIGVSERVRCILDTEHNATEIGLAENAMRRVFPRSVPLSKAQRKASRKLQERYDALCEKHQHEDEVPARAAAQLERIEAAIARLERHEYTAKDLAVAGAFVTLAHDGSVRVERGFVRAEDEPKSKAKEQDGKRQAKDADGVAPLSEKLVAELTAYRTSALRNELAQHPETALLALVHAMALDTFFRGSQGTCLEITLKSASLSGHAPGIDESPAEKQIAERHAAWGKRLPDDSKGLWTFVQEFSDADWLGLLTHCVSLTANAIHARSWPKVPSPY